jgi:hypothetical protein
MTAMIQARGIEKRTPQVMGTIECISQQMRSRESIHGVLVASCSLSEQETNLHRVAAIPVWEGIIDTQGKQWRDGLAVSFFQSFAADPMRPVPAGRCMILS